MKINGSLIFDESSASEIQNLRLQKVTALPAITAGDVGRLVYNTNTNVIHVGANVSGTLSWVPLATGGDASALLSEVDRIETSMGLNADGSFNAGTFTGTLANQTSYVGLITTLQTLAANASAAAAAEATRATAAEGTLTTNLAAEVDRATAAEDTLTTDLAAEVDRATAAEEAEVTRATGVEAGLRTDVDAATDAIAAEVTRATGAEGTLTTNLASEVTARIAGDQTNATAITNEATRAGAAETALDGRITTEVTDRTTAVNTVAGNLASEVTRATGAETALGGRIDQEVTDRAAAVTALRNDMQSALAGLTWEAPVDLIAADATTVDLTGLADGYRIVDLATNTIRTVTGGALGATDTLVDGAAFFNRTNDIGYVFNGTTVVQFNGASGITAGTGLTKTGNTLNIASTSGTITVTEDSIDVAQSVLTSISDNADAVAAERDRAETAESGLSDRIDDEVTARTDAIAGEVTARTAAVTAEADRATAREDQIAGDLAAEVTRATGAEGTLTTNLASEVTRATGVEAGLRTDVNAATAAIAAETTRATGIEGGLRTDLTAETSARTTAVTGLTNRVNSMYFLYTSSGANVSHTVTHNIGQTYCNVTVVDTDDNVVIPESIVFNSPTELTVTFNSAIDCRVVVMGLAAPA